MDNNYSEEILENICTYVIDWVEYFGDVYADVYDYYFPCKVEKDIEMVTIKIKKD
jgi:hypothetical protein